MRVRATPLPTPIPMLEAEVRPGLGRMDGVDTGGEDVETGEVELREIDVDDVELEEIEINAAELAEAGVVAERTCVRLGKSFECKSTV